jgi:hypothetical protein
VIIVLPEKERFYFSPLFDISAGNNFLKIIDIQTELIYTFFSRKQCLIKHGKMISALTLQAIFAKVFYREMSVYANKGEI